MEKTDIKYSSGAAVQIIPFYDFPQLAEMTAPDLIHPTVALSGGSTYAALFSHWVRLKPDCGGTAFFPVDERLVPFRDPQSNWGNAYQKFLKPLGKENNKQHFPSSAKAYSENLHSYFNGRPLFDMVFLGAGTDGHTASLFPGGDYLDDFESVALETVSPKPPVRRITLAPGILRDARKLCVIVAGEGKESVADGVLNQNMALPVVRILSSRKESVLYLKKRIAFSL